MFFDELFGNKILWTAILSWFVAQVIKILIELYRTKKVNIDLLFSSGGMPSSHSSFVTALSTSVGLQYGFDSTMYAITFVLNAVVMYDAANIRLEAGKQAEVLNTFISNVKGHGIKLETQLKELLGHTPIQVFSGFLLGILVSLVRYL